MEGWDNSRTSKPQPVAVRSTAPKQNETELYSAEYKSAYDRGDEFSVGLAHHEKPNHHDDFEPGKPSIRCQCLTTHTGTIHGILPEFSLAIELDRKRVQADNNHDCPIVSVQTMHV